MLCCKLQRMAGEPPFRTRNLFFPYCESAPHSRRWRAGENEQLALYTYQMRASLNCSLARHPDIPVMDIDRTDGLLWIHNCYLCMQCFLSSSVFFLIFQPTLSNAFTIIGAFILGQYLDVQATTICFYQIVIRYR